MTANHELDELRDAPREEQLEVMESWFRARYEDPAHRTPYDGEYIWIWGGPYDAGWELQAKFEGIVPDEVIEELASSLSGECPDWAPTERPGDYDEGLSEAISSNALARQTLDDAILVIRSLLAVGVPPDLESPYRRLLFANAITALETYLSDTIINRVSGNQALIQKYMDSDPRFKERKVRLSDVLREAGRVESEVRRELLDVVWHNVARVKAIYQDVLEVDLGNTDAIAAAIQTRHDIVHRNGRRRDGGMVDVSVAEIDGVLSEITELAARVEIKLDFGIKEFQLDHLDDKF